MIYFELMYKIQKEAINKSPLMILMKNKRIDRAFVRYFVFSTFLLINTAFMLGRLLECGVY